MQSAPGAVPDPSRRARFESGRIALARRRRGPSALGGAAGIASRCPRRRRARRRPRSGWGPRLPVAAAPRRRRKAARPLPPEPAPLGAAGARGHRSAGRRSGRPSAGASTVAPTGPGDGAPAPWGAIRCEARRFRPGPAPVRVGAAGAGRGRKQPSQIESLLRLRGGATARLARSQLCSAGPAAGGRTVTRRWAATGPSRGPGPIRIMQSSALMIPRPGPAARPPWPLARPRAGTVTPGAEFPSSSTHRTRSGPVPSPSQPHRGRFSDRLNPDSRVRVGREPGITAASWHHDWQRPAGVLRRVSGWTHW